MVGNDDHPKRIGNTGRKADSEPGEGDVYKRQELDASYVGKVVALMEEDPTRTDLQVAEILVRQE